MRASSSTPSHRLHHIRKLFRRTHDPLWHMQLGVLITIGLQLMTSSTFLPFHKLWLTGLEIVLLISLMIVTNEGYAQSSRSRRQLALALIGIIAAINVFSLILLLKLLFFGGSTMSGHSLLLNGLAIYLTNLFMFALWYWELDGGGPDKRSSGQAERDFLFPQMSNTATVKRGWLPGFADYAYVSTTNVTSFAPADAVPLTHRAKVLMLIQSLISVITVVLVLARAINVLG